jgi:hypothetical protein
LCRRHEKVERKVVEGSVEVKLPTAWTDGKAGVGRVREEKKRQDQRRERVRRRRRRRCAKM